MRNALRATLAVTFAVLLAATSVASAAARAAPRRANTAFDGLWSVSIYTLRGDCDRAYRYPLRIVGGRVIQADADPTYQLYGAVGHSGAIRVIVARGGQWADGTGRLSDGRGAGTWHTSTGQCAGQWVAQRRG